MQLRKELKNFLIFLVLVSFSVAHASPVKRVKSGETVPFTGWCFTDPAMAKMIADKEQEGARCKLKLDKLTDELNAKHELNIMMMETRLESLQAEYLAMDQIKTEQIEQLEAAALKRPNNYWYLFTAGGFAIGATTVLVIVSVLGN